jgi:DNA-binding beta-propeller fold protein YncE
LGRIAHGIEVDTVNDEIVVTNAFAEAILFFRGEAKGEETPIRIIQGTKTLLKEPKTAAVDGINNEVFVPQQRTNSILVFRRDEGGDVAPIRIIHGLKTKLDDPRRMAVDPGNNLLVVTNGGKLPGILIFDRTAVYYDVSR